MSPVNPTMSQGMGLGQLDRLSQSSSHRIPSRPAPDITLRIPQDASADGVRLSDRARSFVATRPVDLPPPGDPGGDSDLAASIRKVEQFLKEHPRIKQSSFGKSVQTLMCGAVHLVKTHGTGDTGGYPPEAHEKSMGAVGQIKEFLGNHPRVASSPFGQAVAEMGQAIVSTITMDGGDPGATIKDKVIQAARQAQQFLEAHPKIAAMPLGQAVAELINGIGTMGEGNYVDPDIQNLAKRIGHFVGHHPRLAEFEFGQLVSNLTRGMLVLDTTVPPDVEPPVVGDSRPDVAVPVASVTVQTTDIVEKADIHIAAEWRKAA
jgi:hypothetical protein